MGINEIHGQMIPNFSPVSQVSYSYRSMLKEQLLDEKLFQTQMLRICKKMKYLKYNWIVPFIDYIKQHMSSMYEAYRKQFNCFISGKPYLQFFHVQYLSNIFKHHFQQAFSPSTLEQCLIDLAVEEVKCFVMIVEWIQRAIKIDNIQNEHIEEKPSIKLAYKLIKPILNHSKALDDKIYQIETYLQERHNHLAREGKLEIPKSLLSILKRYTQFQQLEGIIYGIHSINNKAIQANNKQSFIIEVIKLIKLKQAIPIFKALETIGFNGGPIFNYLNTLLNGVNEIKC